MMDTSALPSTRSHIMEITQALSAIKFFMIPSVKPDNFMMPFTDALPGGDAPRGNITRTPGSAISFKSRIPAGFPLGVTIT